MMWRVDLPWALVRQSLRAWLDDDAASKGAALAYYTLFSLAPLLLIVVSVAGLVFGADAARGEIFSQLQGLLGAPGAAAVQQLLASVQQPAAGWWGTALGLALMLLGATSVFAELQNTLDRIWRAPLRPAGGLWLLLRARLLSFGLILGLGFLLMVSLVLSAAVAAAQRWWAPGLQGWDGLLALINLASTFGLVTLMFAMIYKVMPRVRIEWSDVWVGALVTACLFTVGRLGLGLYLGMGSIGAGFGAAGSLVVLLVWVYCSAQVFLLGAELTGVYAHALGSRRGKVAGLGLALLASGCAAISPVSRADLPAPASAAPPQARAVAQQLAVSGQRGRLSRPEREQLLARLGREGSASLLNRQLAAMPAADAPQLYAGNSAQLLIDGPATFAAMFAAIEQARSSVLVQSYIVEDSAIARQLAALLARKRAQGVAVLLLYDALGSIKTSPAFFDALQAAGVPTCAINPVNPLQRPGYWAITERDHRKIVSVDRQVGFTGGINISASYASGSFGRGGRARADPDQGWRDTQVRLQGPAVAALDDLVRQRWIDQGCQGALPALPAPPPGADGAGLAAAPGKQVVRVIASSPGEPVNRIYTLLLTAIDASQRSVHLTVAYFAPGADMVDALCDAAERGVDVQLVLPAQSDFGPVLQAGRSYYSRLLQAGVKLHELQDATLHAKTAVIDGVLSTVGSSNLDWRSLASNSEVNAVVFGQDFGDAMEAMFRTDVGNAAPVQRAAWQARPMWQRGTEWLARCLERFW